MDPPPKFIKFLVVSGGWLQKINKPFVYLVFAFLVIFSPYLAKEMAGTLFGRTVHEQNRAVTLIVKDFYENGKQQKTIEDLVLIGTTQKYTFFLKSNNEKLIISSSSIVGIKFSPNKKMQPTPDGAG